MESHDGAKTVLWGAMVRMSVWQGTRQTGAGKMEALVEGVG